MQPELYFLSYPSGGYGYFVYHVITNFFDRFQFQQLHHLKFDNLGTSHKAKLQHPVWHHDPDNYSFSVDQNRPNLLLIDNGLHNEKYTVLRKKFPEGLILRLCIDKNVRPVIYNTYLAKAKQTDLITENIDHIQSNWNGKVEDFEIREHYTLFYHQWPLGWTQSEETQVLNLSLQKLITTPLLFFQDLAQELTCRITNSEILQSLLDDWNRANQTYFKVYYTWIELNRCLDSNQNLVLPELDLHEQGYINYCIEQKYDVIIPVYDYKDWFKTSNDIKEMVACLK